MRKIICHNQSEFDKAINKKNALIILQDTTEIINISGSASVSAHGSASVSAYDSASVSAYGSAIVSAYDSAIVSAYGSASVSAHGSASVSAYDSAIVSAYGSASVSAYGSASVSAYDSAIVSAYGSASVSAYDYSSGIVFDNAHILVVGEINFNRFKMCGNGSIKEWKEPSYDKSVLESIAKKQDEKIILYKVVSRETLCGFHQGEIKYEIGKEVVAPDWENKETIECGNGLHLCLTPLATLKFGKGKILKCLADPADIAVYHKSIEKIRCRSVTPISEVDIRGNEIKG